MEGRRPAPRRRLASLPDLRILRQHGESALRALGVIAQQIGYEGVDLTVMEGGHVNPHITNVDLVRAIESVRGPGLEVPMITTAITTINDPTVRDTRHHGTHARCIFPHGFWPYGFDPNTSPDIPRGWRRFATMSRVSWRMGGNAQMTAMLPNRAGAFVGEALWDAQAVIGDMDPQWAGYYSTPHRPPPKGASRLGDCASPDPASSEGCGRSGLPLD